MVLRNLIVNSESVDFQIETGEIVGFNAQYTIIPDVEVCLADLPASLAYGEVVILIELVSTGLDDSGIIIYRVTHVGITKIQGRALAELAMKELGGGYG